MDRSLAQAKPMLDGGRRGSASRARAEAREQLRDVERAPSSASSTHALINSLRQLRTEFEMASGGSGIAPLTPRSTIAPLTPKSTNAAIHAPRTSPKRRQVHQSQPNPPEGNATGTVEGYKQHASPQRPEPGKATFAASPRSAREENTMDVHTLQRLAGNADGDAVEKFIAQHGRAVVQQKLPVRRGLLHLPLQILHAQILTP